VIIHGCFARFSGLFASCYTHIYVWYLTHDISATNNSKYSTLFVESHKFSLLHIYMAPIGVRIAITSRYVAYVAPWAVWHPGLLHSGCHIMRSLAAFTEQKLVTDGRYSSRCILHESIVIIINPICINAVTFALSQFCFTGPL